MSIEEVVMSIASQDLITTSVEELELDFRYACLALAEARASRAHKDTPAARRLVADCLTDVNAVLDTFLAARAVAFHSGS